MRTNNLTLVMEPGELSVYQRRILEFVRSGRGNGMIQATAGAGKTTTLVEVARALPAGTSACFLAFGRDAAAELSRRLPTGMPAMTVHRLGRQALYRWARNRGRKLPPVDVDKYRRLASQEVQRLLDDGVLSFDIVDEAREYLNALLTFGRLHLVPFGDDSSLLELADRHLLVPPAHPDAHSALRASVWTVLNAGLEQWRASGIHDFTDMLYLPLRLDMPTSRFDFVCVDEAQDYSTLALEFTMRLAEASKGRLVFVGDPRQSIFGFAGADPEAMTRIRTRARAVVLPLSISYRCPTHHVALARILAPEIESRIGAPTGSVRWINEQYLSRWVRPGDLIVGRSNAPLLRACLALTAKGQPSYLLGHDLSRHLKSLALRAMPDLREGGSVTVGRALQSLDRFSRKESTRLGKLLQGKVAAQTVLSQRRDLFQSLRHLLESQPRRRNIDRDWLAERISVLFRATPEAVVLSTVHRAKGREAERVLILHPERMRGPYARSKEGLQAEECVQFVALTRARSDLVFVVGGDPREKPGRDSGDGKARDQGSGKWNDVLRLAWEMAIERGRGATTAPHAIHSSVARAALELNASLQGSTLPLPTGRL